MSELRLFKPYPVSPQAVRGTGSRERRRSSAPSRPVVGCLIEWRGPRGPVTGQPPVHGNLIAAMGALDAFAAAIGEFNETSEDPRSVAKLNEAYRSQQAANFGLDPADYRPGSSRDGGSYEKDLTAARLQAIVALYDEYTCLEWNLNAAADRLSQHLESVLGTRRSSRLFGGYATG